MPYHFVTSPQPRAPGDVRSTPSPSVTTVTEGALDSGTTLNTVIPPDPGSAAVSSSALHGSGMPVVPGTGSAAVQVPGMPAGAPEALAPGVPRAGTSAPGVQVPGAPGPQSPDRVDPETQPIRLTVGSKIPDPDADSIDLVRTSFWYLGDVDLLSQRFDARLLCLTPRAEEVLRRYFPREGERFVSALLRPIEALAAQRESRTDADAQAQLRALGARLHTAGMRGQDFSYIGLALVRAVRDSYSAQWNTTLGSAWSEIHNWIVPHLDLGARDADLADTERTLGARVMRLGTGSGEETAAD